MYIVYVIIFKNATLSFSLGFSHVLKVRLHSKVQHFKYKKLCFTIKRKAAMASSEDIVFQKY